MYLSITYSSRCACHERKIGFGLELRVLRGGLLSLCVQDAVVHPVDYGSPANERSNKTLSMELQRE